MVSPTCCHKGRWNGKKAGCCARRRCFLGKMIFGASELHWGVGLPQQAPKSIQKRKKTRHQNCGITYVDGWRGSQAKGRVFRITEGAA